MRGLSRRVAAFAVVLVPLIAGACGDDAESSAGPIVDQIKPAVEALEGDLGPQEYFEINADRNKVTLWVATDGATAATPYVYAAGDLSDAQESREAAGETFSSDAGLSFEPDVILDKVVDDLGDAVDQFSVVGAGDDGVRFSVIVQSEMGGTLEVVVGPDGQILESGPV